MARAGSPAGEATPTCTALTFWRRGRQLYFAPASAPWRGGKGQPARQSELDRAATAAGLLSLREGAGARAEDPSFFLDLHANPLKWPILPGETESQSSVARVSRPLNPAQGPGPVLHALTPHVVRRPALGHGPMPSARSRSFPRQHLPRPSVSEWLQVCVPLQPVSPEGRNQGCSVPLTSLHQAGHRWASGDTVGVRE